MPLGDLRGKWESFGWHVLEIDGNNMRAVVDACRLGRAVTAQPTMVIANTVPGKGVRFMEFDYKWHGAPPNDAQAIEALENLKNGVVR